MRKILVFFCIVLIALFVFTGCKKTNEPSTETQATSETEVTDVTEELTLFDLVKKSPMSGWNSKKLYACADGSSLYTYANKRETSYNSICEFFKSNGFSVYSVTSKVGNLSCTMTRESQMVHVYYYSAISELNVVLSETAAVELPPQNSDFSGGEVTTTVTQIMESDRLNGMGYIIQLSDGSFIIYDGGFPNRARALLDTMTQMKKGSGKIKVRAWVLTHSHADHYSAFNVFANNYASKVELERVIVSPVLDAPNPANRSDQDYLTTDFLNDVARFNGAVVTYVHSGMEFNFCDLKMEILLTADDVCKNNNTTIGFNDTSIVSRLYTDDYSMLILGDSGKIPTEYLKDIYGEYLKSDVCQASHHGGDDVQLSFYETVKASIMFYPCNKELYDTGASKEVREALAQKEYTKEILISGIEQYTINWGYIPE